MMITALSLLTGLMYSANAQNPLPAKPFVVSTNHLVMPEGWTFEQVDSVLSIYKKILVSFPFFQCPVSDYLWGNDSRDIVLMYEVKNWEDLINNRVAINKATEATFPDKDALAKFRKTIGFILGWHSDEIYRVIE